MPTTYAIPNGRTVMDATLVTGVTGGTQTITNAGGFKPDLIWTKTRSAVDNNYLVDSVRGTSNYLISNSTAAEASNANFITGITSTGYSYGSSGYGSGITLVGWQWQAGQGSTSSNTSGSITSTVSVNASAGFSIVTYTGTGVVGGTVGHGLGVAPSFIVVKDRTTAGYGWLCYHSALGVNQYIQLNGNGAAASLTGVWGSAVNSTTFGVYAAVGSSNNALSDSLVAYCWAEIAGFSKFGSYTGNGSSDGPFIYTGFRPKFVMYKAATGSAYNWSIYDTARDPYNTPTKLLYPNSSSAEDSPYLYMDILSNGFKIRAAGNLNENGSNYIYACFAENPLKFANAR